MTDVPQALVDLVRGNIQCAAEGGYEAEIFGFTAEELADDMIHCTDVSEGYTREQVIAAILATGWEPRRG